MNRNFKIGVVAGLIALAAGAANADVVRVSESNFTAAAGLITFSSGDGQTYTPADYGGGASAPTVTFGGYFVGQSIATDPSQCPVGAALTGCVLGSPTGTLALDPSSPATFIADDGSNPTSPVLSGSPTFNGPITILFSTDQYGVGLDGGYFNNPDSTAITAFDREGNVIGSVTNVGVGIEFLGLVTDNGLADIAGLQFSLVGDEPAGFAIDNVRFGAVGEVTAPVPEPESIALLLAGLGVVGVARARQARKSA